MLPCVALGLGPDTPLPVAVIEVEEAVDGEQLVQALVRRIPAQRLASGPADAPAAAGADVREEAVPAAGRAG